MSATACSLQRHFLWHPLIHSLNGDAYNDWWKCWIMVTEMRMPCSSVSEEDGDYLHDDCKDWSGTTRSMPPERSTQMDEVPFSHLTNYVSAVCTRRLPIHLPVLGESTKQPKHSTRVKAFSECLDKPPPLNLTEYPSQFRCWCQSVNNNSVNITTHKNRSNLDPRIVHRRSQQACCV